MRRRLLLLAGFGSVLAQEARPVRELRIAGGLLPAAQRRVTVTQGERVRWRVSSDAPGELHLHAYRLSAAIAPGQPADLDFTAFATGRFPVSWHAQGAAARPHAHGEAPLAWLEVRPR